MKKVPYYKANRIVLETEVLKLDLLPWPKNWCVSIHCLRLMVAIFDACSHFNISFQQEEKRLSMMEWAIKECRTVQLVSEVIASKFQMEAWGTSIGLFSLCFEVLEELKKSLWWSWVLIRHIHGASRNVSLVASAFPTNSQPSENWFMISNDFLINYYDVMKFQTWLLFLYNIWIVWILFDLNKCIFFIW